MARAAEAARGVSRARSPVEEFERSYGFAFDPFQRRACDALVDRSSVLVAAPTGAGKTVVGEFAAWLALKRGGKAFYTTPIKALSNQKYSDFLALHGSDRVGLLTGDNSINGDAPVVVMTTEVLRNMIYEDAPDLAGLRYVVLDEVHYLQDPYRGAVWEEVLIHLPVDVQIVSLSATVSNAEEFGEWLQTLRGRTEVIIEETRPVELRHWYFAGDELLPMFVQTPSGRVVPNPRGRELERRRPRPSSRPQRGGKRERVKAARIPYRSEVIERLAGEGMLPAIYFVFSRKGCTDAVQQCLRDGLRLTTEAERQQIVEYGDLRVADLSDEELAVLGYDDWIAGLARGIASHHAGLIPPFKEAVEQLFVRGLVKVVFATETLALGINMPARTVVIENLVKFGGERHEMITPGQYTQFAGRAGRRGIDELGHSVVLYQRFTRFDEITRLASTRTYPLVSSFRPSYNMAVNLVRNYDRADAEHLVNSSFAQFQTDRDVVKLEHAREELEAYRASYEAKMECERGDIHEYLEMVDALRALEGADRGSSRTKAVRVAEAVARLRPGDVILVTGGKRRGRYAVVEVSDGDRRPRALVVSERNSLVRLTTNDFRIPPEPIGRVPIPKNFDVRDPHARRGLARRLIELDPSQEPPAADGPRRTTEARDLARRIDAHAVARCPDLGRHLHFADRSARLRKELASYDRRISRRSATLSRRFERVLEVLEKLGYVDGWTLSDKGDTLARVYNESDLLVTEAIERGLLEPLGPADLVAVCSALVYETRGPEPQYFAEMPTTASREVYGRLMRLFRRIEREEEARGVELTREPDPGFAEVAYMWASGASLDEVVGPEDAPGDFVRTAKQLVDLLRQLEEIGEDEDFAATVGRAIEAVSRGVVAYSSLEPGSSA